VNPFGKPVAGNVEYRVYKLSWSWWWDSSGEDLGSYVLASSLRPMRLSRSTWRW
jgi:hypothetical protein